MHKDFDSWNEKKKVIQDTALTGYIHEREIWWCSIGLNVGHEQDGKNDTYERPVLVLKKFNRHVVLVVPLTTKLKDNPYYFPFTHESTTFAVILSQIRLLSTNRFDRRIRKIDHQLFQKIRDEIMKKVI